MSDGDKLLALIAKAGGKPPAKSPKPLAPDSPMTQIDPNPEAQMAARKRAMEAIVTPIKRPVRTPATIRQQWKDRLAVYVEIVAVLIQALSALGIYGVAIAITWVSLTHLAEGIEMITHVERWEAYTTAIGIDIGMLAMEFGMMVSAVKTRETIMPWANGYMIGALAWSGGMNALIFSARADTWYFAAVAVVIGLAYPAAIYVCNLVGAKILITLLD